MKYQKHVKSFAGKFVLFLEEEKEVYVKISDVWNILVAGNRTTPSGIFFTYGYRATSTCIPAHEFGLSAKDSPKNALFIPLSEMIEFITERNNLFQNSKVVIAFLQEGVKPRGLLAVDSLEDLRRRHVKNHLTDVVTQDKVMEILANKGVSVTGGMAKSITKETLDTLIRDKEYEVRVVYVLTERAKEKLKNDLEGVVLQELTNKLTGG
ncbi:hypothetical protein CHUUTOTORO_02570 [Serratia phage vB_SmaM-ChuuTotoro]|nr:hypothetical protein CHUUTOTORO_02570 [Serratia phage vB_SmaM-ChuuTotoro]